MNYGALAILVGASLVLVYLWRREKARLVAATERFDADRASLVRHFDHLTRYANDAILLFDEKLKVLDANAAALRLYGYSLERFRELTMLDLRPVSGRVSTEETVRWVNEVGTSRYETLHVNAEGKTFPVEATLRVLELDEGRAYQNIIRDITERKAQQAATERLTVVYSLLTKVNQALARYRDEDQLFQRVCHLAVNVGGYSAAAVYLCDGQTAKIVAEEGIGASLASNLTLDLTSPATRKTVTACAIRENRLHSSNDYTPPQGRGLRDSSGNVIGYGSIASCPLKRAGTVVGAISFIAASTGFYTKDEISLIEVLAGDISNALDLLAAQRELSAVQNRARQLFTAIEQCPVSIVITDATGVIEYANPKFVDVSGYSPEELVGQNPRVLKSGEMSPEGYRQLWQTITGGKIWRGEFHNRRKNGDLYWESAIIAPVRDEQGKITRFVSVKEDTTELKAQRELAARALHDLTAAEQHFRSLFEDAPVPYHEVDAKGIVLRVNRAECELLQINADQLIGTPVWQLLESDEQAKYWDQISRKLSGTLPLTPYMSELRRGDGSRIVCEIHDRIIQDGSGNAVGMRSALFDVTARVAAEQERAKALQQTQEASLAKQRFLAIVSHELRTPLNGILGTTALMLSSTHAEQDIENLHQVHNCALDLLRLVQHILTFTESEAAPVEPGPFRLAGLIEELSEEVQASGRRKGLATVVRISPDVPEVIVQDRKKLELLLRSLLDNAVKFTPSGEVGLSVDASACEGGPDLKFRVWNTGTSIPEEKMSRIFDPFFQTDMTDSREHDGVGLGLAIVGRLAKSMDGRISIEADRATNRTTFQFVLPA